MTLLSRRTRVGLGLGGVICLVIVLAGAIARPEGFFQAYLVGYTFWLALALGCLGLALIHVLTGGRWGWFTRRIFESGAATLPLLAILFLPILAGLPSLYPWTATSNFKTLYLNVPFFVARAAVYFVAWMIVARLSRRWSVPGLLVLGTTASFAAIDWWMSLEPEWFSTMYPAMICIGDLLLALAFAVLLVSLLGQQAGPINPGLLNDLGSLLLAFLMLWAYMTYFQYMLIWSGNLPEEITWYLRRAEGSWLPVAWSVAGFGFGLPFALLLFRGLKRNARWLASIAALIICTRLLEVYWLVEPAFAPAAPVLDWRLPLILVGIGALWWATFAWRLAALPPIAADDARLRPSREAVRASN